MIPLVSFRKLNAAAAEILGWATLSELFAGFRLAVFDELEVFVVRDIVKSYTNIGQRGESFTCLWLPSRWGNEFSRSILAEDFGSKDAHHAHAGDGAGEGCDCQEQGGAPGECGGVNGGNAKQEATG